MMRTAALRLDYIRTRWNFVRSASSNSSLTKTDTQVKVYPKTIQKHLLTTAAVLNCTFLASITYLTLSSLRPPTECAQPRPARKDVSEQ